VIGGLPALMVTVPEFGECRHGGGGETCTPSVGTGLSLRSPRIEPVTECVSVCIQSPCPDEGAQRERDVVRRGFKGLDGGGARWPRPRNGGSGAGERGPAVSGHGSVTPTPCGALMLTLAAAGLGFEEIARLRRTDVTAERDALVLRVREGWVRVTAESGGEPVAV
jgi:hypothetical protein